MKQQVLWKQVQFSNVVKFHEAPRDIYRLQKGTKAYIELDKKEEHKD